MKKEYWLVFAVGLFLLAYVLDAVVDPLGGDLATPYQFLIPSNFSKYPFTMASIVIKSLGVFIIPLLLFSFFENHESAKGALLLVLIALLQLYAIQEVATGAGLVPVEWAISLAVGGIALFIPMVIYFLRGMVFSAHKKLAGPAPTSKAPDLSSSTTEDIKIGEKKK